MSMETSRHRLDIIIYAIVAVLIIIIGYMCFGKATFSTTPNLDLDKMKTQLEKIETQLHELQGNMKNEMLELKQGFSFSISTTKQELMNKIPGNEKNKETCVEVVRNEIENSQRIKTMENNINNNKETFVTIDTTIFNIKEDNENNYSILKKSITDNVESIRQTLESTANEFSRKFGIVNNLEIKLATTEKNVEAFEMKFATPEQLDKMTSFIEDAKQQVEQLNVAMDKSKDVLRKTLESTANDFDRIFGTVNNLEIKLATTEKNVKAFEMKFATQEQLDKMTSFSEDAKQQVEQLNVAMDKSKEVLQKYGDTQKLIHQNTFDKDAMIFVLLIIIGGLAGLSFYVCVYKPWQPKESRHSNLDPVQSGKGNTMSMNVNEG